MVDQLDHHQHQKQQDSGAMFLKSNDDVFLMAWIVTMLNIMAVQDRIQLKTKLAMVVE